MMYSVPVEKDEDRECPVPSVWRGVFYQIVDRIISGDVSEIGEIPSVEPLSQSDADRIFANISDYGASLVSLPEEAWVSSVCQWQIEYWDILVDLFTAEGSSDLVMFARVYEDHGKEFKYRFEIMSIHVP